MFWGITLDSGKKYTQVLQRSFCVTMAALGFENASNDNVFVVAEVNNSQHVLCSLQAGKIPQQVLNLSFTEGEHVSFFIEGEGQVHLTGYLTPDDDDSDLSDDDDSDNEENIQNQSDSQSSQVQEKVGENGENTEVSNISWQGMLSGSQEDVNKVNGIEYGMDVSPDDIEDHPCDDEDIDDMLLNQNCVENGNNMNRINGNEETSSEVSEALDEKGVSKTRRSTSRRKKKDEITQVLIDDDASSSDASDSTYMIAEKEQKSAAKRKRSNTDNSVDQKSESKAADKKPRNNGIKPQSKQSNKKTDNNSKKKSLKRDPPKKEPVKNKKTSGKSK